MLQDLAKVPQTAVIVSSARFVPSGWLQATVPGTVLTSLVNDGVYPEPLYGENNRPGSIPESLCRTSYWYRTLFTVPGDYTGRHVWLNFEGINYTANVWVNGHQAGVIRGAFARGTLDITPWVTPGETAVLAVLFAPPPHPQDNPPEQTAALGLGPNGGELARDGPTFLCTQGWDWIPAIRDRDMGIWQKVTLSSTGPVLLKDPYIGTKLPLPRTDSADVSLTTTLENLSAVPQEGVLHGEFGGMSFALPLTVPAKTARVIKLTPQTTPQLRIAQPRLWWPNGYGDPYLYALHLSFDLGGAPSDTRDLKVGIREISYAVPGSEWLTLSVNGVPVYCKGGNWGMDEAMKRLPRERLEAQLRLHREANYTMIRNWVGQSTSEDFYDLCDRNGILVWDELFQPNPGDSGRRDSSNGDDDIADIPLYLANVREKILRFRNHPSIALWCGRNEGMPTPAAIDAGNRALLQELDPVRFYQPSSTDGRGVRSHGPYAWRSPVAFYNYASTGLRAEVFKTEIGSVSIPTIESIQSMLVEKDWDAIGDDAWAEHDLAHGANHGDAYPAMLAARYGRTTNLAGFVRAAQLANYEAFRAMYEGRLVRMFQGSTAVLTWMSNPAQPSLTWQIYSYDLEPFASFFATRKACEPVHVLMNEQNQQLTVINHTAMRLEGLQARVRVFNLDGALCSDRTVAGAAAACAVSEFGPIAFPADGSAVHFVNLELRNAPGRLVSDNFYWRGAEVDNLTALNRLPAVTLEAGIVRRDRDGRCLLDVTLVNPTKTSALMAHVQLRRQGSNERVLPVYYSDNYISLRPAEARTISIEAAAKDLGRTSPLVVLDGWNVTTSRRAFPGDVQIAPNTPALVR